jgi:DNA topoisomerase-1
MEKGLRSDSGFSNFGGQAGVSVTTNKRVARSFGTAVIEMDTRDLKRAGFSLEKFQHATAPDEKELRVVGKIEPTVIDPSLFKRIIRKKIPKYEQKWWDENYDIPMVRARIDTMQRAIAELVTKAAIITAAEDPQSYKKRVGRCPRGYRFDGEKCVPSGSGKKKGKGKDNYKLSRKVRKAKTVKDIPGGAKGIKDAFGKELGITKYPPPDIDPSTIKINLDGDADSHAVMTWKDKKGRTQSAYSTTFKKRNAAKKWDRVKKLEKKFEKGVSKLENQLDKGKTDRDKDAAAAMLLIAKTGLRPGGETHLKASGHRGIGTLSPENVTVEGDTIKLKFIGKAGKENIATLTDPKLAKYLASRLKNPASKDRLFGIKDADLQKTMNKSGLKGFKPKDFRTRQAGQLASGVFSGFDDPPPLPESKKEAVKLIKQRVQEASKAVADKLNNTPSVAKNSYINPAIIHGWLKLVGGEEEATPIDEEDPQLEEDPLPV